MKIFATLLVEVLIRIFKLDYERRKNESAVDSIPDPGLADRLLRRVRPLQNDNRPPRDSDTTEGDDSER